MLRRRMLWLTVFSLAAVLATTRLPFRLVAVPSPLPHTTGPMVPVGSFAVVPRLPSPPPEKHAESQLIPTEVPADSVHLLPNFTPPADIRLLVDAP